MDTMLKLNRALMPKVAFLGALVLGGGSSSAHASEVSDGLGRISTTEIRKELESAPPAVRASMSQAQMSRFISNLLVDRRLEQAAKAAGTGDLPEVRARIERSTREILVRAFVDREYAKMAETLPDLTGLARERYETNKASYTEPEAIRVAHILFRVNEEDPETKDSVVRAKAEKVLKELQEGGDFGKFAREQSADSGSARQNGELLGWMDKGKLVPPFEEAAYALKPGQMSGLVRTRFGYHIIKLIERRGARTREFDEVKDQILQSVQKEVLAQKQDEFMKRYRGPKPIDLDEATFKDLKKP